MVAEVMHKVAGEVVVEMVETVEVAQMVEAAAVEVVTAAAEVIITTMVVVAKGAVATVPRTSMGIAKVAMTKAATRRSLEDDG